MGGQVTLNHCDIPVRAGVSKRSEKRKDLGLMDTLNIVMSSTTVILRDNKSILIHGCGNMIIPV